MFSPRKAAPHYWYDFSTGVAQLNISLTVNTQKNFLWASIYIHDDKKMFEKFNMHRDEIENEMGGKMEWRVANKDCRILISHDGNIKKESSWPKHFEWLCNKSLKLKEIIEKYV